MFIAMLLSAVGNNPVMEFAIEKQSRIYDKRERHNHPMQIPQATGLLNTSLVSAASLA
jgi:hypothetical protein